MDMWCLHAHIYLNEFIQINVALHLMNNVCLIKMYIHCTLISNVCHVYIVILYVFMTMHFMYKSTHITISVSVFHVEAYTLLVAVHFYTAGFTSHTI